MNCRLYLSAAIFTCFAWFSAYATGSALPLDSIGVEKKNGKTYVLHKVEAKETLYSLSKRYQVTIDDLKKENPELTAGLKVGQVLKVPSKHTASAGPTKETGHTSSKQEKDIHKVASGETLYSIAKKYDLSVQELKNFNPGLEVNNLQVGQELKVKKGSVAATPVKTEVRSQEPARGTKASAKQHQVVAKETLYSISKRYKVSIDALKKANPDLAGGLKVGQVLTIPSEQTAKAEVKEEKEVKTIKADQPAKSQVADPKSSSAYDKVEESGFAEVIEGNTGTPKFLALHKTAPIGTIIHVTNEANGQKVFVRVIGKLPDTGVNDRLIIKLSQKAYERLEAVNKRFPVELTYIP